MKTYLTLLILSTLILFSCRTEKKRNLNNQNFIFTIDFNPSQSRASRIILQNKDNKATLMLDYVYGNKRRKPQKLNELVVLKNETLPFPEIASELFGDTIFLKKVEKLVVKKDVFKKLNENLERIDLLKMENKDRILIDGISVYFKYENDSSSNQFYIKNPMADDSTEFLLINSLFNLFENSYKTEESKNYIAHLKSYFEPFFLKETK